MSVVVSRSAAIAINHMLEGAPWAQKTLREHAGKRARFSVGGIDTAFVVDENGMLKQAEHESMPDVTIEVPLGDAIRFAAGDATARQSAKVDGDARFAADIWRLAEGLRWDAEEDLSKVVGDIAAHRIVGTARAMTAWVRDSARRVESAYGEYATEEAKLLPPRAEIEEFYDDVDRLRDDVERLEQRIARLETGAR